MKKTQFLLVFCSIWLPSVAFGVPLFNINLDGIVLFNGNLQTSSISFEPFTYKKLAQLRASYSELDQEIAQEWDHLVTTIYREKPFFLTCDGLHQPCRVYYKDQTSGFVPFSSYVELPLLLQFEILRASLNQKEFFPLPFLLKDAKKSFPEKKSPNTPSKETLLKMKTWSQRVYYSINQTSPEELIEIIGIFSRGRIQPPDYFAKEVYFRLEEIISSKVSFDLYGLLKKLVSVGLNLPERLTPEVLRRLWSELPQYGISQLAHLTTYLAWLHLQSDGHTYASTILLLAKNTFELIEKSPRIMELLEQDALALYRAILYFRSENVNISQELSQFLQTYSSKIRAKIKKSSFPTLAQETVQKRAEHVFSTEKIEKEFYIKELQMSVDMYLVEKNMVIQFDGPCHFIFGLNGEIERNPKTKLESVNIERSGRSLIRVSFFQKKKNLFSDQKL